MCWSDPSRVSKTCSTFSAIYTWPCCPSQVFNACSTFSSIPCRVSKTCSTFSSIYTWPCCLWHQHYKCQSKTRLSPSHNCQRLCWLSSRRLWSPVLVLHWQFLGGRQSIYFVWFRKCFRLVCALWPNGGKTQRPLLSVLLKVAANTDWCWWNRFWGADRVQNTNTNAQWMKAAVNGGPITGFDVQTT